MRNDVIEPQNRDREGILRRLRRNLGASEVVLPLLLKLHVNNTGLCTDSSSGLTAQAWMKLHQSGSAPPLRFPVGMPVKCFVGDGWVTGTVVKQNYREPNWPAEQPTA